MAACRVMLGQCRRSIPPGCKSFPHKTYILTFSHIFWTEHTRVFGRGATGQSSLCFCFSSAPPPTWWSTGSPGASAELRAELSEQAEEAQEGEREEEQEAEDLLVMPGVKAGKGSGKETEGRRRSVTDDGKDRKIEEKKHKKKRRSKQ